MTPRRFTVAKDQAGRTLQDFLSTALGVSRNRAKALIDERLVFVNTRRIWMARHELRRGDRIEVLQDSSRATPANASSVLFQDSDYIVADKPAGRLSNGDGSMEEELRNALALPELSAVHRLDRDTTGCLLFARRQDGFDKAVELFRNRRVLKLYHAIAAGRVPPATKTIETPVDGEAAATSLQILDSNRLASHLKLKIETGRTHQIRKHLESIGHPVLGDRAYGNWHKLAAELRVVPRQMLHAACIQFESPFSGAVIRAESPLPADFRACLRNLRLT